MDTNIDSTQTINKTELEYPLTIEATQRKECIIIVGAFKRAKNVDQLKERLSDEGYVSFTKEHKGLTRVGIYHSCDRQDLQQTLSTIQEKYAKDAMILTSLRN